jgi:hypothetical protein
MGGDLDVPGTLLLESLWAEDDNQEEALPTSASDEVSCRIAGSVPRMLDARAQEAPQHLLQRSTRCV